jgi:hypothetical protein
LQKPLYDLKQAPKQWHKKFDMTLITTDFSVNDVDRCVYYHHGGGQGVILCLFIEDILIFGTSLDVINEIKTFLCQSFDTNYRGETDVFSKHQVNERREWDYSNAISLCGKDPDSFWV